MLVKNLILVGFVEMIGSVLRYLTAHFIRANSFPYATFTVNMVGSLLIGAIMGYAARQEGFTNW